MTIANASTSSASWEESAEQAKQEVGSCEKEILAIKGKLRGLGAAPSSSGTAGAASAPATEQAPNRVRVSWLEIRGLPETAKPRLSLQLSSPIEDGELTARDDPLVTEESEKSEKGMLVDFTAVEMGQATLTVTAADADIPLGSSKPYDLSILSKQLDAMSPKEKYVHEIDVIILPSQNPAENKEQEEEADAVDATIEQDDDKETGDKGGNGGDEAVKDVDAENEKTGDDGKKDEAKTSSKTSSKTSAPTVSAGAPVCTVTLRLAYSPSAKDQREELYELLNKTSRRKAAAVEKLRQLALQQARQQQHQAPSASSSAAASRADTSKSSTAVVANKPAVQAGFLNKKKAAKEADEPSKLQAWFDRWLGTESIARRLIWGGRNVWLFLLSVALMHYRGHLLALPPPV